MPDAPLVIDLFSGVGGLSLSAVKAGFDLRGAVEIEDRILECHKTNFPNSLHLCSDVSKLTKEEFRKAFKVKSKELAGLIGGPPCQGFSAIGKRNAKDNRNRLFTSFFGLISELQPAFFLAENVPGILDSQYAGIRRRAFKLVEDRYNILEPLEVNASEFGAATSRTRIFFIGVRNDIKGFDSLLGAINASKPAKSPFVKDALVGLPLNINEEWITFESSWRALELQHTNEYLAELNNIYDGIGNPAAIKRFTRKLEVSGCFGTRHSKNIAERYGALFPGQSDPISKSIRLKSDGFCPTLRAGTDNTKGSFQAVRPIHPSLPRVITPREAARLQGFPDWFQFHETKWHSFRQIGNSVCPVAASRILQAIRQNLSM
jgi:DNA (cytosine-5)-methyltransferase 1